MSNPQKNNFPSPICHFPKKSYINETTIHQLEENITLKTIELRQHYRIKTPDAIIAATALVNDFILISGNIFDFKKINGLRIINSYDIDIKV